MKSAIGLSLVAGALTLSNEKTNFVAQQPLIRDACPSNAIIHNEECQPLPYDSSTTSTLAFQSNTTHILHTLDESRILASQTEDFPWTFWPECFSKKGGTEPYCVFSDQTFASGRGIFIVTTQTRAYAMLEKGAFSYPETLSRARHSSHPPFYTHDFPGKGRGLVANKTLQRGDQIFASMPILITDPELYSLATPDRLALLHRGISTLPVHTQSLFWALMGRSSTGDDPVDDRITTNNFEVRIDGAMQSALIPEIAMLNHDCRPNAAYFFDEETLTHFVHAIRPILPGEEITITYVNNELDRDTRVKRLETYWGFTCACSSCTAHPDLVRESDSRLQQIVSLQETLNDWSETSAALPAVVDLLVSLIEQERLYASLSTAYKHAAEVYSSFGMRWEAVRYARLSVELTMLDKGFADQDVNEMKMMAREPATSWSWKKRVGLKGRGCGCGKTH
ncbi:SET domain-containing protein [Decorospora gaudefroyi]|uniref:SET domain-containing protein n=1 Tax=Decorospora gaudefroyi TaxID=184978 RepID=A0A6A5K4K4_9PLEO|nr:SET domain-containing protein [Decorospora gaudefroyi]